MRAGRPAGDVQRTFESVARGPSADEVWYASDPSDRPLDAELTPRAVLETLTPIPLVVHQEAGTAYSSLQILSPTGIVLDVAPGVSGPTSVLTRPDDVWTIWAVRADERIELGQVPPQARDGAYGLSLVVDPAGHNAQVAPLADLVAFNRAVSDLSDIGESRPAADSSGRQVDAG